jgi:ribonuclease D
MKTEFIEDYDALESAIATLAKASRIALDTEFESNRSGTTLSLVQISDGTHSYVIDALALRDLSAMEDILNTDDIVWIVHAGRQDIELLAKSTRGSVPSQLFDTQVAWALCGPEYQVSLAYLVARLCDTHLPKSHQNDYWLKRPLSAGQIQYAADDVKYLHQIYNEICARFAPLDKTDIVFEVSDESMRPSTVRKAPVTLASYRNLWQLDHRQKAALRYLVQWYQKLEGASGKKPVHHKVLFDVAATLPESTEEMASIKSVPARFAHGIGKTLISGMLDAADSAEPTADAAPPNPYASYRKLFNEAWLHCARVDICHQVEIAVELGFPQWLQNNIRALLDADPDPGHAQEAFKGWRSFLKPYWIKYCDETFRS